MKVREALAEQSHLHLSRVMHPDWAGVIKLKRKSLYLAFTPDLAWTAGQSFALRFPHRRVSRSSLVQEFRKAGEVNRWRAITLAGGQQQGVHLVRHNIATTIILHYTQVVAFMCPQSKHHPILRFLRHLVLACVDFVWSMFAGDGSFALHVFVLDTGCLLVYFGLPFLFQCGWRKGYLMTTGFSVTTRSNY